MIKKKYKPFDNFVIRIPLKPLKDGFSVLQNEEDIFEKVKNDKSFLGALYLASNDLYNALLNYDKLSAEKKGNVNKSLLKYYLRATSRCTPFGLFSACGIGNYSENNNLISTIVNKRVTRLDMDVLHILANIIKKNDIYSDKLLYYPNTSLYSYENQFRYLEHSYDNKKRKYSLEAINKTEYLNKVIEFCKIGKNKIAIKNFLAEYLIKEEHSYNEIADFIESLIDIQILVVELEPNIIGDDYLQSIIKKLEGINTNTDLLEKLKLIDQYLGKLDNKRTFYEENYIEIRKIIESILKTNDNKYLFQTDSILKLANNSLSKNIPEQINIAVGVLSKIFKPSENNYLEEFKNEFIKKYEGKTLSLAFLMDNQTGLDFINRSLNEFDYIENININKVQEAIKIDDGKPYNLLFTKVLNANKKGNTQIELTNNEVNQLNHGNKTNLPPTYSAFVEVFNEEDKPLLYLKSISGSTATNLLSRFTQQSKSIKKLTDKISQKEKKYYKDRILAEIVHLPQSRVGNVLKSQIDRNYEIVYLSGSQKPIENQIKISDLFISVKENKIILFSKKLDKEIVPILSNAHNYNNMPLPTYKFLCELQRQESNYSGFNLNELFKEFDYIPRVTYKNIILFKARWKIEKKEFEKIANINLWLKKRLMPRYLQLIKGDNLLLIDFKSELSIEIIKSHLEKNDTIELQEFIFDKYNGTVIDDNSYTNEYIIPFYCE